MSNVSGTNANQPPKLNLDVKSNTIERRRSEAADAERKNQALAFAGSLAGAAVSMATGGAVGVGGLSAPIGGAGGMGNEYAMHKEMVAANKELFRMQTMVQHTSQVFNTQTNISKTEHETKMSAIRNMRSG